MKPFLDSTDVVGDGSELDKRMQRDGYLFVRGLLPADLLENLRLQLLELARQGGWVKGGTPLEDGIADLDGFCLEPEPKYNEVYHRMYKQPDFHAMQQHPNLIDLLERMTGEKIVAHPRVIGRTIFPQREAYTTPPHQDFVPIQGAADTYTAWFPLSTLSAEMGGLQIAAGSHLHGVYDIRPSLGAGGMEIIDPIADTWVSNPFEQGDVLFFHSMVVHQGVSNSGESLRLSMDGRYQKLSDPINPDSLMPHIKPVTWEEIYADWPAAGLQYYWKEWEVGLEFKEYDSSYFNKRDQLAFEMAARGDVHARSTLQRILARDKDPAKREKAEKMLVELDATIEAA
jgi:hypothetical protein